MQPNYRGGEAEALGAAGSLALSCMVLVVWLAIIAVVCYLLYGCFKRVPPEHRKMEPGLVWLLLIPLFHLVWNFFVFLRLPESYDSYFASVGQPGKAAGLRTLGLWTAIVAATTIVPCLNALTGPATLVLLIIYLVQAIGLKNQIPETADTPAPPAGPIV